MIHRIVQFALRQKPIVLFLVAFMTVAGAWRSTTCRWMRIRICRRRWWK
jgi:Cu/Ag efflux pump CusA